MGNTEDYTAEIKPVLDDDLKGVGVKGMEDIPGLSAADMQYKLEEIPREVIIPTLNKLINDHNRLSKDVAGLVLGAGQVTPSQIARWDGKSDVGINLLHNADWAYSLVNQRGHSGAVSDAYCVDRWIGNGSVTPTAGQYVSLVKNTTMTQRMEILPAALGNKQLCFSIDIDGEIQSIPIVFPSVGSVYSNGISLDGCDVELGFVSSSGTSICGVQSTAIPYLKITPTADINIKRSFLEFGKVSHMVETPPVNHGTNELVCFRYYYRATGIIGWNCYKSSAAYTFIIPPAKLRITPTAICGAVGLRGTADGESSQVIVGIIAVNYDGFNNVVRLTLESEAFSKNQLMTCITQGLELNAEL